MIKWPPIATAPTDGTLFVAYYPNTCVPVEAAMIQIVDGHKWISLSYGLPDEDWLLADEDGWPTHWTPLPEPPE